MKRHIAVKKNILKFGIKINNIHYNIEVDLDNEEKVKVFVNGKVDGEYKMDSTNPTISTGTECV
jgi:hypothetical protein